MDPKRLELKKSIKIEYKIPRWRPDRARIWLAPAREYISLVDLLNKDLSPSVRAAMTA